MEVQCGDVIPPKSRVVCTLRLGSEVHSINAINKDSISEQLVSMKEQSMSILKDFITKHNVPNDVPDDLVESASEEDTDVPEKPLVKSKKTKIT